MAEWWRCLPCDIDAIQTQPLLDRDGKTTLGYDASSLLIGSVAGAVVFLIPFLLLPPSLHFFFVALTGVACYGIHWGMSLMQDRMAPFLVYTTFLLAGPIIGTWALSLGPEYATYVIGGLWCLHGAVDLLHHQSVCCSPTARRMYGLAELHRRFAWEPLMCLGFDLAMGLGCAALADAPDVRGLR
jgi:hypothetical protein